MIRTAMIWALMFVAMASCANAASPAIKLDELAAADPAVNEHADEWALALQQDPTTVGYVIAFEARTSRSGAASKAADKVILYMLTERGIGRARLHMMTGGRRPTATIEFWVAHAGEKPPVPR